jgi:serine/threonine-protein kinase
VASVCARALDGLHYAHTYRDEKRQIAGVIHRDVSPDNVLLGLDGSVKVADFGIAKALRDGDPTTRTHLLKGKIAYMAPEQLEGKPIDARTDQYGMGVVLYELLTGVRPFAASTDALLIHAVLSGQRPRPPRELEPALPPELEAIVLRALSRDPSDRFPSASALAEALRPWGEGDVAAYVSGLFEASSFGEAGEGSQRVAGTAPISEVPAATELATPPSSPLVERPPPPQRRRRASAALGIAMGVAVTAVAAFAWRARPAMPAVASPAPAATAPPPSHVAPPVPAPVELTAAVPERPRPPTKPGKVAFRVYPWAEVFYRGKSLGVTPIAPVETPAGLQSFILKNPQLSQEKEVHVAVPSGGTSLVKYDFFRH